MKTITQLQEIKQRLIDRKLALFTKYNFPDQAVSDNAFYSAKQPIDWALDETQKLIDQMRSN